MSTNEKRMVKKLIKESILIVCALIFVQCTNSKFNIAKGKVGEITIKTTVQDLDKIFANDSIVKVLSEGTKGDNYFQDDDEYLVFEKGGKHLLTIIPKEQLDSSSTIKSVQIFDDRFKTESNLSLISTFEDINANNKISKVETSLSSATLFIDDLNATIAIDKEELGLKGLGFQKVSLEQIPDLARMKSFIVWFE